MFVILLTALLATSVGIVFFILIHTARNFANEEFNRRMQLLGSIATTIFLVCTILGTGGYYNSLKAPPAAPMVCPPPICKLMLPDPKNSEKTGRKARSTEWSDGKNTLFGQAFGHVDKKFLSMHSAYFKAMFEFGFKEKEQAEIELKELDFNEFVELTKQVMKQAAQAKNLKKQEVLRKQVGVDQKTAAQKALIFKCPVCMSMMPDAKSYRIHFESKHPKESASRRIGGYCNLKKSSLKLH